MYVLSDVNGRLLSEGAKLTHVHSLLLSRRRARKAIETKRAKKV